MSDDLVKRLRTEPNWMREDYPQSEAADRIEAQAARIAELEEELSIWRSVFPDIAPERVLPDRSLLLNRIAELEAALQDIASGRYSNVLLPTHPPQDPAVVRARAALEGKNHGDH